MHKTATETLQLCAIDAVGRWLDLVHSIASRIELHAGPSGRQVVPGADG